jgi:proteasome accessory factor C
MSASEQLERLLYILPVAARQDGATVDELARALNVDRETVLHDLEQATARAYYQPAGHVDRFEIYIEGDVVRVHTPDDFQRPVRLSRPEALALGLGLRALAAEAEVDRRAAILALAAELEKDLTTPELELQPRLAPEMVVYEIAVMAQEPVDIALGEDELRGSLSDAIALHRVCRITYLKPSDRQPVDREIEPHKLIYASGHWYVSAQVATHDEPRMYRLDRILGLQETERTFEEPAPGLVQQAVEQTGEAFMPTAQTREVQVRYSPRIARWIAEQRRDVVKEDDGSVVLTHQVADETWLVRHVLQYGGEAVVENSALRSTVAQAAARLIA